MTGKELKERYPFLKYDNVFDLQEDESDNGTYLDDMPDGWRKAFGEQMCEEIFQALLSDPRPDALEDYRVGQIKEKYGGLRWYDSNGNEEIDGIISKYENVSRHTCVICGNPATKISLGWISPFCDACARKLEEQNQTKFVPIREFYTKDYFNT